MGTKVIPLFISTKNKLKIPSKYLYLNTVKLAKIDDNGNIRELIKQFYEGNMLFAHSYVLILRCFFNARSCVHENVSKIQII